MSFIKITCAHPGLRRAGIAHEKVKTWPADALTADQLALLRADPAFTVEVVEGATEDLGAGDAAQLRRAVLGLPHQAPLLPVFSVKFGEGDECLVEPVVTEDLLCDLEELFANEPSFLTLRGSLLSIFGQHGWNTPEGRSGTAREAPSASSGSDAGGSAPAPDGTQSAAPHTQEPAVAFPQHGESGSTSAGSTNTEGGAAGEADPEGTAPTTSTATTISEGAAAPVTTAASAAPADPNGEGGKGEAAAVRPAASASAAPSARPKAPAKKATTVRVQPKAKA